MRVFIFFFKLLKINARTPANGRARELAMSKSVTLIISLFDVKWKKAPRGRQRKTFGRMARTRGEQVGGPPGESSF